MNSYTKVYVVVNFRTKLVHVFGDAKSVENFLHTEEDRDEFEVFEKCADMGFENGEFVL